MDVYNTDSGKNSEDVCVYMVEFLFDHLLIVSCYNGAMNERNYFIALSLVIAGLVLLYPVDTAYPPSNFHNLKRMREEVIGFTKSSPDDKISYQMELLDRRLQEIEEMHVQGKYGPIITASSKYSATAGKLTALAKHYTILEKTGAIREQFSRHSEKLQSLSENYPAGNDHWKFLSNAMNYLKVYESELPK